MIPEDAAVRLRGHQDITGYAMKLGTILGMNGFEAIRDAINNWLLGLMGLI
jgi:hypothetical protein